MDLFTVNLEILKNLGIEKFADWLKKRVHGELIDNTPFDIPIDYQFRDILPEVYHRAEDLKLEIRHALSQAAREWSFECTYTALDELLSIAEAINAESVYITLLQKLSKIDLNSAHLDSIQNLSETLNRVWYAIQPKDNEDPFDKDWSQVYDGPVAVIGDLCKQLIDREEPAFKVLDSILFRFAALKNRADWAELALKIAKRFEYGYLKEIWPEGVAKFTNQSSQQGFFNLKSTLDEVIKWLDLSIYCDGLIKFSNDQSGPEGGVLMRELSSKHYVKPLNPDEKELFIEISASDEGVDMFARHWPFNNVSCHLPVTTNSKNIFRQYPDLSPNYRTPSWAGIQNAVNQSYTQGGS